MAKITLKGSPVTSCGELPLIGQKAPDFCLVDNELADRRLEDWAEKVKILSIVPSLDTPVCALSTRQFNQKAAREQDLVVLVVSADLPFAQGRFCLQEKIQNVVPLSQMRDRAFGKDYGVEMIDGPLRGILCRAVVVIDRNNTVVYTEQVKEISSQPDYEAALATARKALT
jgi:thiol peroxidase